MEERSRLSSWIAEAIRTKLSDSEQEAIPALVSMLRRLSAPLGGLEHITRDFDGSIDGQSVIEADASTDATSAFGDTARHVLGSRPREPSTTDAEPATV